MAQEAQTSPEVAGEQPAPGTLVLGQGDDCLVPLNSRSLHDLASPINQVCAMAELLRRRYGGSLDDEADALFGFIENSSSRLHKMMDGLQRYMQIVGAAGPCRNCDGNRLLASAIASVQPAIDEQQALITYDGLPEIYCNPTQIGFAFASLIENSIKFRRGVKPEVHISAMPEKDAWVFAVRDNGLGIAGAQHERIFGVFARVHQQANPGAGVGLAIVRRVIELHRGRLWVNSEVGRGTTVSFSLPHGDPQECASA